MFWRNTVSNKIVVFFHEHATYSIRFSVNSNTYSRTFVIVSFIPVVGLIQSLFLIRCVILFLLLYFSNTCLRKYFTSWFWIFFYCFLNEFEGHFSSSWNYILSLSYLIHAWRFVICTIHICIWLDRPLHIFNLLVCFFVIVASWFKMDQLWTTWNVMADEIWNIEIIYFDNWK